MQNLALEIQKRRQEWILNQKVDIRPERSLARAVLGQWLKDLKSVFRSSMDERRMIIEVECLVGELASMEFWFELAQVSPALFKRKAMDEALKVFDSRPGTLRKILALFE